MASTPGPRVLAFVEAFCTEGTPAFGNATDAALAAGYGKGKRKSARELGCHLRKQARVQKLIAERLAAVGVTPATIRLRIAGRFFDEKADNGDVARLGKLLAEMTPGALVPQKVDISGGLTLRELVAAAAEPEKKEG